MGDNKRPSYTELDLMAPAKMDLLIQRGELDRQYCMGYLEHRSKQVMAQLSSKDKEDGKTYNYPSFHFGMWAYQHLLEQDIDYNEAMMVAAQCLGHNEDWVKEVRNKRFNHSGEVYKMYKEHPVQKYLKQTVGTDPASFTKARSVVQLLKRLSKDKDITARLDAHEAMINYLLDKDAARDAADVARQAHLDIQEEKLNTAYNEAGLPPLTKKDEAKMLYDKGWMQKDIAEQLGVSRRTVIRWCKDF